MNVLLSAGEVSGDIVGASIAAELRRRDPSAHLWGLGGARMQACGVEVRTATNDLGRVGVSESFSAILPFLKAFSDIRRQVRRSPPDLAILVANDVFNAVLGRWLRGRGIPTLAVFPPQVWIWKSLLRFFSVSYDAVAAAFPVELKLYSKQVRTVFVGHHLADTLSTASAAEREAARTLLGLDRDELVVGLLPGSRIHEVQQLGPILLDASKILLAQRPALRFVMPVAEPWHRPTLQAKIDQRGLSKQVRIVDASHEVMRASDLLLMASGTATLEATLIGTPMIAIYRVFPLTMFIVSQAIRLGLMDSETFALPNLLSGKMIVPEIKQKSLTPERVAQEAAVLLDRPELLSAMRMELAAVRSQADGNGSTSRTVDLASALASRVPALDGELVPVMLEEAAK
jgi:lipid-A-disaccharide synthase